MKASIKMVGAFIVEIFMEKMIACALILIANAIGIVSKTEPYLDDVIAEV